MSIETSIVFNFSKSAEPQNGGRCPSCGEGELSLIFENCSCHIRPPCPACTDAPLRCDACGSEFQP